MKFAIAGAGAMGCRLGYQLYKAEQDVILIDTWEEHVEAIRQNGLKVDFNGEEDVVKIPVFYPNEVNEKVDVVIVLTKAMQLSNMLEAVKPLFHDTTKVVCLLNGLGHEEVLKQYVALENIIMGTTIWTAGLEGPGRALLHGVGNMDLQSFVEDEAAIERAKEVVAVLDAAGLTARYSDNVKYAVWKKATVNGCANAATALAECNLEVYFNNVYTEDIVRSITQEFSAVAAKVGVDLNVDEVSEFVITASRKVGAHYTSMYQDLVKNHRLTEVDYINGAVARMGKEYGVATPVCDVITQLIHIKELALNAK